MWEGAPDSSQRGGGDATDRQMSTRIADDDADNRDDGDRLKKTGEKQASNESTVMTRRRTERHRTAIMRINEVL